MEDTNVNVTETVTEVATPVTAVTAKKAPTKNAAPSDKSIIQKLRAEAKAQDAKIKELEEAQYAKIKELEEALEIQQSKNVQVFNKYQEVAKELERQREKFSNSKSALLQTIDGALRAFTNI